MNFRIGNDIGYLTHFSQYSQIEKSALINLFNLAQRSTNKEIRIEKTDQNSPFREKLNFQRKWFETLHEFSTGNGYFIGRMRIFNDIIYSIVGISLLEFLTNYDRRKLKLCNRCDKFSWQ